MLSIYKKLISKIIKKAGCQGRINLLFVDDKKIQQLNRDYRHKDCATDVLAFPMGEDGVLGDMAISVDTAKRNAKRFGVSYNTEMKRLVVHGALHLLGYDHGKEMRHAEEIYQKL